MAFPLNDDIRRLAANGLNGHLGDLAGTPAAAPAGRPAVDPPKVGVTLWVPGLRLRSEPNEGGGLRARVARKAAVKAAVRDALKLVAVCGWRFPLRVSFRRVGKRLLDGDNLQGALKVSRDVVAEWVGVDDGDEARVTWHYAQERARWYGLHIAIEEV